MSGIGKLSARVAQRRGGKLWRSVEAMAELLEFPLDDFQISLIVASIRRNAVIHISAMRKIGKTHILALICFLLGSMGKIGIYTSHKKEYVLEFFNFCRPYAEKLQVMGVIARIEPSNGFHNIFFHSGGEIKFRTRSASFGRGGMKLDFVLFDEAQKVHLETQTEVSGTMALSDLKLEIHTGNPATKKDLMAYPSSPFTAAKVRTLDSPEKAENWIEFSAADRYDPELQLTAELLAECNPNAHRLGDLQAFIDQEFENGKSHETIAAEYFGIWNLPESMEKTEPEFTPDQINKILTRSNSKASKWYLSVAMDFKATEAYIVINDGTTIEVAGSISLPHGSVEPVAEWILERRNSFRKIFIMKTGKGKQLITLLESIKNRIETAEGASFSVYLARFMQQVENGTLRVSDTDEVRAALGSFHIGHDRTTNAPIARASTPEQVSLIMSLMMATVDEKALSRIRGSSGAPSGQAQAAELVELKPMASSEPEPLLGKSPSGPLPPKPEIESMDPMAMKKRARAEQALAAKKKEGE